MNRPIADLDNEGVEQVSVGRVPAPLPPARRELAGRLSGLSLPRQVYVLAIWPFFEQVLNFLVGFVDMALAGHLRPEPSAVAAVNALAVAGYIGWLIGMLQMAIGVGSTAIIARAIGARHRRVANASVGQSLVLAAGWGVGIGASIFFLARPIGRFAELDAMSLDYCVLYLRIICLGAPLSAILFVGNACLRGAGDTRSPFWVMVAVNVVNTGTSVLLVWAPAPIGGHGIAGIAAGTALAWAVGAALTLTVLVKGWGGVRLYFHRLVPHAATVKRILRVGVPNFFESLAMWSGNFLVLKVVGMVGAATAIPAPGAHMIVIRLEAISFLPGFAIGTAAATLAGQYLGLQDPARARRAVELCWGVAAAIMGTAGLVFIAVPELMVRLVTDAPPLLEIAPPLLRLSGWVQVFFATYAVLSQAMRGAGDTRTTMLMTTAMTFLVRLPLTYVLAIPLGLGLRGVWIGLVIELGLRGTVFAARFVHGGWLRVKV